MAVREFRTFFWYDGMSMKLPHLKYFVSAVQSAFEHDIIWSSMRVILAKRDATAPNRPFQKMNFFSSR